MLVHAVAVPISVVRLSSMLPSFKRSPGNSIAITYILNYRSFDGRCRLNPMRFEISAEGKFGAREISINAAEGVCGFVGGA